MSDFPAFLGGLPGLLQLAELLENEQKWRDIFLSWDFGTEFSEDSEIDEENKCGTLGCALGLAHIAWPKKFRLVFLDESAEAAFEIDEEEVADLFYYCASKGKRSHDDVTPADVAAHIRRFVADKEAEK